MLQKVKNQEGRYVISAKKALTIISLIFLSLATSETFLPSVRAECCNLHSQGISDCKQYNCCDCDAACDAELDSCQCANGQDCDAWGCCDGALSDCEWAITCDNSKCGGGGGGDPEPEPSCTQENRCRYGDEVWKFDAGTDCSGWLYKVEDCSSSGSWSAWYCKNTSKKQRKKGTGTCSNGSCTTTDQYDTVNCPNGCSAGKCQPFASFTLTPNPANAGDTITLNAQTSRDPYNGTKLKYEWFYDSVKIGEGKTLTHTIPSASTHQIKLKVTTTSLTAHSEDNGTTDETSITLTVHSAPKPVINAPSECVVPCGDVDINAVGTTDETDPPNALTYEWDYESNGVIDATYNNPLEPGTNHPFTQATGTYNIKLKATNTSNLWTETTHALQVKNNPPNADFKMIPFPATGITPLTIIFIDKSTDPDGHAIVSWNWDFGDMQTSSTQDTQHEYNQPEPKQYTVTLTVKDQYGATGTKQATVKVKQRAQITYFNATDPIITPTTSISEATTVIELQCNKPVKAQIRIFTQDGKTVTDKQGKPIPSLQLPEMNCDETTPPIQLKGFPQPGVYKLTANITSELCENCPKTKHIIVKKPQKQASTPESTPILTALIATTILIITSRKKTQKNTKQH